MIGDSGHIYRFDTFTLNVGERQLLNNEAPVPLTPKAFDVLVELVANCGHLVEKDHLLKKVWADSFVEEANIARIVHTLRKAVGEDDNGSKFIETVAKRGYRFVAKVTAEANDNTQKFEPAGRTRSADEFQDTIDDRRSLSDFDSTPRPAADGAQPSRTVFFTVGFAAAISLVLLLSFNFWPGNAADTALPRSIAILPLIPVAPESREPIIELGIPDSLITRLSTTKGLVVRHLSSTRRFTDLHQDPVAAGRELKVDYVLASNYQLSNGRIRITSQLFNVETAQIEESYKTEKDAGQLFLIQDAIAGEVGNWLLDKLAVTQALPGAKRGTSNEEAYALFLNGKSLAVQRGGDDAERAIEALEKAIALDPAFAEAHARVALAYHFLGGYRGSGPMAEKARESVKKAFELDGSLAEAYAVRGIIGFAVDWQFSDAERDLLRAIELDPNHDLAHWGYALLSCYMGRFDIALNEIETAQTISPGTVMYSRDRGRILYYARRYDESIAQFKRALELNDNVSSVWGQLWLAYEAKGDYTSAFETRLKFMINGNDPEVERYKRDYETGGMPAIWRNALVSLKQEEAGSDTNFYAIARLCNYLGDKEQAIHYLNKTYEKRQFQMAMLLVDPTLDPVRDDPRFDELVKKVGLK